MGRLHNTRFSEKNRPGMPMVLALMMTPAVMLTVQSADIAAAPESQAKVAAKTTPEKTVPSLREFEMRVRDDFFAGMAGDSTRFERAMKFCEQVLARDPRHAEALVWHGGGLLWRAGQVSDIAPQKSRRLWTRGLDEMGAAVKYAPNSLGIHVGRGATLISWSQMVPNQARARQLLEQGIADYEKVLEMQRPYFHKLPTHNRGELLFGLAEGWHRLGNEARSRAYFERIVKELDGTEYAELARPWLDPKASSISRSGFACVGCHVR